MGLSNAHRFDYDVVDLLHQLVNCGVTVLFPEHEQDGSIRALMANVVLAFIFVLDVVL